MRRFDQCLATSFLRQKLYGLDLKAFYLCIQLIRFAIESLIQLYQQYGIVLSVILSVVTVKLSTHPPQAVPLASRSQ